MWEICLNSRTKAAALKVWRDWPSAYEVHSTAFLHLSNFLRPRPRNLFCQAERDAGSIEGCCVDCLLYWCTVTLGCVLTLSLWESVLQVLRPSATFYRSEPGISSTGTRHGIVAPVRACLADMIFKKVSILFSFQLGEKVNSEFSLDWNYRILHQFCILRSISWLE